jgi:hypothetical protein
MIIFLILICIEFILIYLIYHSFLSHLSKPPRSKSRARVAATRVERSSRHGEAAKIDRPLRHPRPVESRAAVVDSDRLHLTRLTKRQLRGNSPKRVSKSGYIRNRPTMIKTIAVIEIFEILTRSSFCTIFFLDFILSACRFLNTINIEII